MSRPKSRLLPKKMGRVVWHPRIASLTFRQPGRPPAFPAAVDSDGASSRKPCSPPGFPERFTKRVRPVLAVQVIFVGRATMAATCRGIDNQHRDIRSVFAELSASSFPASAPFVTQTICHSARPDPFAGGRVRVGELFPNGRGPHRADGDQTVAACSDQRPPIFQKCNCSGLLAATLTARLLRCPRHRSGG